MQAAVRWVAAAALLLAGFSCERSPDVRAGDEFFAVAQDAVLDISLRAPDKRAEARRLSVEEPFTYVFQSRAGIEHCGASAGLDAAIAPVHSIRVRDVIDAETARRKFAKTPVTQWIDLEVHTLVVEIPPLHLRLLRDDGDPARVYARLPEADWAFTVDAGLLSLLDLDCSRR